MNSGPSSTGNCEKPLYRDSDDENVLQIRPPARPSCGTRPGSTHLNPNPGMRPHSHAPQSTRRDTQAMLEDGRGGRRHTGAVPGLEGDDFREPLFAQFPRRHDASGTCPDHHHRRVLHHFSGRRDVLNFLAHGHLHVWPLKGKSDVRSQILNG